MVAVQLIILVILGAVCASIASSKGRSVVGWFFAGFFLGLIGLIIICCMDNLKDRQEQERWSERERRRLREQLKQERLKTEAFRQHTVTRLDAHDNELGVDTRSVNVLPSREPANELTSMTSQFESREPVPVKPGLAPPLPASSKHEPQVWHYEHNGNSLGPVGAREIREMVRLGKLKRNSLVWKEGFVDWQRLELVAELKIGELL